MEITVYLILVAFNFLLFYLAHTTNDGDEVSINGIVLKLLCGICLIGLGTVSTSLEYYLPNGSPSSYTPVVNIMESGNRALLMVFILLGVLHLSFALLDAFEYAFYYRISVRQAREEKQRREDYEFDTGY